MNPINEYIAWGISLIKFGLTSNSPSVMMDGIWQLLPIVLIPFFILTALTITAIILSIKSYRTNKKILKKLEEKKDGKD